MVKSAIISHRIPDELLTILDDLAKHKEWSRTRYINQVLAEYAGSVVVDGARLLSDEQAAELRKKVDEVRPGRPADPSKPPVAARIPVAEQKRLAREAQLAKEQAEVDAMSDEQVKIKTRFWTLGAPMPVPLFQRMLAINEAEEEERQFQAYLEEQQRSER
jgi:predicted transcriptional regulator